MSRGRTHQEADDLLTGPAGELMMAAMRSALREELLTFFGDPTAWKTMSSNQSSMQSHQGEIRGTSTSEAGVSLPQGDDEIEKVDKQVRAQHFAAFTQEPEWGSQHRPQGPKWLGLGCESIPAGSLRSAVAPRRSWKRRVADFLTHLWSVQEPERTGVLADIVVSRHFDRFIQIIILCNCVEMGFSANYEMDHVPHIPDGLEWTVFTVLDCIFQGVYTIEMMLKLVVHRQFFFWNDDFGFNIFDVFILVSGYVELILEAQHAGATALRTVRILKLGKALRSVKIVAGFRTLRAILVCIQGSFVTLLWSMIMLFVVWYIFSLIFVQQSAARISEIGDLSDTEVTDLMTSFGNVQTSVLTLSKASLGGDDWAVALDVLSGCDEMTKFFYLLFIAFSQIALINIILGIFVDNAMVSLAPNKELLATTLNEEETSCARELEKLCSDVDTDQSGCLTKAQFNEGAEGRIPLLLQLLGLNRHNVNLFFDILCDASPDKQVDIKSFVRGCMRLKGAATSFDVQTLVSDLGRLERNMAREVRGMSERMASVEKYMVSGPRWPMAGMTSVDNRRARSMSPMYGRVSKAGQSRFDEYVV